MVEKSSLSEPLIDRSLPGCSPAGGIRIIEGRLLVLYRLPMIPRCGRVNRQAYHVWGMEDAGILFSQRTGGGRAAALGTTRERACLPAGSDDREHARGDGAWGSGAAGWAEPVSGLRMA